MEKRRREAITQRFAFQANAKTEAISMSEQEILTKVKIKKSQEKYLSFANLAIQEFCGDIKPDMNDVNRMLYACAKTVESKLGVKKKT